VRTPSEAERDRCTGSACAAETSRSAGGALTVACGDADDALMPRFSPSVASVSTGRACAHSISRSLWVRLLVVEMAGTYTPARGCLGRTLCWV